MSDVFQKLKESIKTTLEEATEQTQKSVDQTVYRTELISKKSELRKLYQKLGYIKYEEYKSNSEDVAVEALYIKITSLINEIEELESKVDTIVSSQKDSFDTYKRHVKTTWNDNMAHEKRPEKGPDGVEIMKICSHCNTGNHVEASYCISCGSKF